MPKIVNPILKGFHPDPCMIRVDDTYYIATSTFEWFPGVLIYCSKDMVNWEFCATPLNRVSQLDLQGVPNSCGIFAPALSYCDGVFYLMYTIVKTSSCFQDTENYLVTCESIDGDWSEPIYINSSGFDPSLFHDTDGRKWVLNRDCDTREYNSERGGIIMREYDHEQKKLVGEEYRIYRSTKIIGAEGPHIYKYNGYYYLLIAEGGTDYNHVASMARSEKITGPYESDPNNPFLSSRDNPFNPLQKAGHASLVQTQTGEFYIAHLVGRPIPTKGACVLGRETALQKVYWDNDGWLKLSNGGIEPSLEVEVPEFEPQAAVRIPDRFDFDDDILGYPFQTMRVPLDEKTLTLKERQGYLRLYGRDSLHSKHFQSLVARRQQSFCYTALTKMDFNPKNYHQSAGLICIYDTDNFYYLYVTRDEDNKKRLNVMVSDLGQVSYPLDSGICIEQEKQIFLRATVIYDRLTFSYSYDNNQFLDIEKTFDYSILSDDYYYQRGEYRFTGAFVGVCAQDFGDKTSYADFDFFEYKENNFC